MNVMGKTAGVALLLLAGCATTLTPEQKRERGLAALQNASTAEGIVEITAAYDCPEVVAEAEKKLADKIDGLIVCGAGTVDSLRSEWREKTFGTPLKMRVASERRVRIERYIDEEQRQLFHRQGVSSEDAALEKERKFHAVAQDLGKSVMLDHSERLTSEQIALLYEGWNLGDDVMNKLITKDNQELAHSFYKKLVGSKAPGSVEPGFATVLSVYLKLDTCDGNEYAEFLKRGIASWPTWKNDQAIRSAVVAEMQKRVQCTAHAYLFVTQAIDSNAKDADMAFAQEYFNEDTWAEMYMAIGRKKSQYGYSLCCRTAEYRKNVVAHVKNAALAKRMLMSVTGFDADEDIGLKDCIAKLNSESDVVDVARNAVDEDVRKLALNHVKDYKTIADSIEAETNVLAKVRNARVLIRLIKNKANVSAAETAIAEKMNKLVTAQAEAIVATSRSKTDKSFVLHGFYVGMSEDDAEMLIGWYYPNAEVLQQTVDDRNFSGTPGLNHGRRYLSVDGVKFCDVSKSGTVTRIEFTAKMLYDWLGFEDAVQLAWVEKFRARFNLPEFVFHIEQKNYSIMGVHKIETVGTYYYRHPNGWKVTHYGDKHHSAHGNVSGERQHLSRNAAGGTLVLE